MTDVSETLHAYILREFLPGEDAAELTTNTPLITGGILDSISTLRLVTFLEEHFGITIEAARGRGRASRLHRTDRGAGGREEAQSLSDSSPTEGDPSMRRKLTTFFSIRRGSHPR